MRPALKTIVDVLDRLLRGGKSKRAPERQRPASPGKQPPTPGGPPPSRAEPADGDLVIEYTPTLDGDADPGEVVWTWVPYEEDPSQGKDRPVVIIGHSGRQLIGVPLTSKRDDRDDQVSAGTGPWDSRGRESFAKVERVLRVDPAHVRREGAILPRDRFDAIVAGVRRYRR